MEAFSIADPQRLTTADLLTARELVLEQIKWTRQYTLQLVDSVPYERWFERPAGSSSNVAWQVGHLAVSQYGLMLFRQRGRAPGDLELMPGWLRKQFGRGSDPQAITSEVASPEELLHRLETIHRQAMDEAQRLTAECLAEPTEMPFAGYPIKLGALMFCPIHEGLHAGQLGVLRRCLGMEPLR